MVFFSSKLSHLLDKIKSTSSVNKKINERLATVQDAIVLREEFIYGCSYFFKNSQWGLLANLLRDHGQKIQSSTDGLEENFKSDMEEAAENLKKGGFLTEAITLCRIFMMQEKGNELRFEYLLGAGNLMEAKKMVEELPQYSKNAKINSIHETASRLFQKHLQDSQFEQAMEDTGFCAEPALMVNQVVEAARAYAVEFARSNSTMDTLRDVYKRVALLEVAAGNFAQAGRIAEEMLKDYRWAAELYERANLYHRAIAIVSQEDVSGVDSDVKTRLATLHKNGGNLLEAANLYEELQNYREAAPLYEELGQAEKALECYWKLGDAGIEHVIELSSKCGRAEDAINLLLKSNKVDDIERAMNLASNYQLPKLEQKAAEMLERLQNGCLNEAKSLLIKVDEELKETYSSVLGIDFGTTNSVGAIYNKKKQVTEIIPIPGGGDGGCEPSCWGIDEQGNLLYGETARRYGVIHNGSVVFHSKHMLGENNSEILLHGRKYRSEEIAAAIIDHVRQNALKYLQEWRLNRFEEMLYQKQMSLSKEMLHQLIDETKSNELFQKTVLTVPAFYDNNRKQATRVAAEIAGLEVIRLMHEPTAAAVKYFMRKNHVNQKVVVIDLGGGTLDLSFLEIGDGVYEVASVNGNIKLGGKDIDDLLVDYAKKDIMERYNIDLSEKRYENDCARLRDGCENLKIQLSSVSSYTMVLPDFSGISKYQLDVTREKLESIIQPFLSKFQTIVEKSMVETKSKGFLPEQVILVGNATRMPAVERIVSRIFGMEVKASSEAGTIVAAGAALQGAVLSHDLSDIVLLDVVPYSLNIVVKDHDSDKLLCHRMIERNTTIPITHKDTFCTASDNQTSARIMINQGESVSPEDNYPLGSIELHDIPPAKAGEAKINVNYSIDVDCILEVTAQEEKTGKAVSIRVENVVMLSPAERAAMHSYFNDHKLDEQKKQKRDAMLQNLRNLLAEFEKCQKQAEHEQNNFTALFKERVEEHSERYKATNETFSSIQEMFMNMDEIQRKKTRLLDQIASIRHNMEGNSLKDMPDEEAFQYMIKIKDELKQLVSLFQSDILLKYQIWNHVLRGMPLDVSKLSTLEAARALMISGDVHQARPLWECVLTEKGCDSEAFQMLLRCDVKMGKPRDYREHHRIYGTMHGLVYPDFNYLDDYLVSIRDMIFLVVCSPSNGAGCTGTAFAVGNHWLATCSHVLEDIKTEDICIIGNGLELSVLRTLLNPKRDLALIEVAEEVSPLRMSEFRTASPGESVLAVGFPKPNSRVFNDNLSISRGVINSVRQAQDGRRIFMDAKIAGGNSGGPLLNSLGEVIGINTFLLREFIKDEELTYIDFEQPIAIPIWEMRDWIEQNMN